jgi:hypothetical protein
MIYSYLIRVFGCNWISNKKWTRWRSGGKSGYLPISYLKEKYWFIMIIEKFQYSVRSPG